MPDCPTYGFCPQTSLRLTFFDLAELGYLTWSPQSVMPEIIYCDGDSVSFTVTESNFSFNHICGNHLRDTNEFAPLATHLVPRSSTTAAVQYPLLALRVTLFPDSGICVGQTFNHVAADGISATHFMKFWASVCSNLGGEAKGLLSHSLPSYDRTTIIDPHGIEKAYLNYLKKINITQHSFILPTIPTDPIHDKVVATFIMDSQSIEKLKKWILRRAIKKNPYFILSSVENLLDEFFAPNTDTDTERLIGIFGSPKMGAYDVNFGWGRPNKFEIVLSNEDHGYLVLSERGDNIDRGFEISVTLKKLEMAAFASFFPDTLSSLLHASSALPLLSKY
ncbi:hypothetical protein GIB67_026152 [Kingdonia uniflora]|uniref:Uncharacterized protein n=1 Tax=Kingdonia uniflora TaxID=39325 RepID=A0A7J7M376_9MAGN|nr:hypothetical protein GIB67_026152 [Kingdonia uniflora]